MWFKFIILLALILHIQAATTSSKSQTLIWVTDTDSAGVTVTTQSPYFQTFTSMYDQIASYSSGSIGLGSLEGSVGGIRTYERVTISQALSSNSLGFNKDPVFRSISNISKGLLGLFALCVIVVLLA